MTDSLRITLLRHAHALPAAIGQDDLVRSLSPEGEAEADSAAQWLAGHAAPARVLCSPATKSGWSRISSWAGMVVSMPSSTNSPMARFMRPIAVFRSEPQTMSLPTRLS